MKKWNIAKQFDFCYGHRVWTQELNEEYSLDSACKCRHMHGHQGKIIIHLSGNELKNGMITDFKHLNWFKKFLDDILDHKFIMDLNDPLLPYEVPDIFPNKDYKLDLYENELGFKTIIQNELFVSFPSPLKEKYEGMVFVNFVPTSENISKWLFEIVQEKMKKIGVEVEKLTFFETPKSQSVYSNKQ